jgi:hypothetical protein
MITCANCKRELKHGEDFSLVRVQLWTTKVGSGECKPPDLDKTHHYCPACAKSTHVSLWRD